MRRATAVLHQLLHPVGLVLVLRQLALTSLSSVDRKGYPKCCTKDKGNCPNNSKPGCECLPGNCSGNTEDDRNKKCTFKDGTCQGPTFCEVVYGSCSGVGRCEEMPKGCNYNLAPVCGCNGVTYDNECLANAVGINVDYEGGCVSNAECKELGEAAAEHVVLDHFCPPNYVSDQANAYKTYDATCKAVAYGECEDDIAAVAARWCPDKTLDAYKLDKMQGHCKDQVDRMVG